MVNVSTTTTSYNDGKGLQSLARASHVTVIRLKTVDKRIYPPGSSAIQERVG